MKWIFKPGDHISAALSVCRPYVINHRWQQFTVSYRLAGKHEHVATCKTLQEAKQRANDHRREIRRVARVAAFSEEKCNLPRADPRKIR